MWDTATNRSRGYGFVAFKRKDDAQRALTEMNGELLGSRPIRCNWANQKGLPGADFRMFFSLIEIYINSIFSMDATTYDICTKQTFYACT
jgi:RNA recognition motif-containing protein